MNRASNAYLAAAQFAASIRDACTVQPLPHVTGGKHPLEDVLKTSAELEAYLKAYPALVGYTGTCAQFLTERTGLAQIVTTLTISIQSILQDDSYEAGDDPAVARTIQKDLHTERDIMIATKRAIVSLLSSIFGEDTVKLVTHDNRGFPKDVDDYLIVDIMDIIQQKAVTPSPSECLNAYMTIFSHRFNFQHSLAHNMGELHQLCADADRAFGAPLDPNALALLILPQIYWASRQKWGQAFLVAVNNIKNRFRFNHVYKQADFDELIELIDEQDITRDLAEASNVPDDMSTAFAVLEPAQYVPFNEAHLSNYLSQVALREDPYHADTSFMSDDLSVEEGNMCRTDDTATSAAARRTLLKQAEQALADKETAIKEAKAKKKAAKAAKESTTASDVPEQTCPHCKLIKMRKPHPDHITPETCHANPANHSKAPKFILQKYIKVMKGEDPE